MTGHFPARHSVHQHFASIEHHVRAGMPDWLDPNAPMLPRMLKDAGYATAHYGKWHLCNDHISDGPLPPDYGYDEFGAFNLPSNAPEQMPTTETIPRTINFIKRHADQPFFVNLWLHETHTPHYPLEKYMEEFSHLDEQQQVYAAIVAEADFGIGLLFDTLKELDIDENTLVIFSSDNGPERTTKIREMGDNSTGPGYGHYYSVGESGGLKGRKRSLYAGGIRVPFIVRWPGTVPAGKTDRESVLTAVDLLPTFIDLAGADLPKFYQPDGVSMVDALKGNPFERKKPIFWEWRPARASQHNWPYQGVRVGKWKLLVNEKLDRTELYSIEDDWSESEDISNAHPEVVEKLKQKLNVWTQSLPTEPSSTCFSSNR